MLRIHHKRRFRLPPVLVASLVLCLSVWGWKITLSLEFVLTHVLEQDYSSPVLETKNTLVTTTSTMSRDSRKDDVSVLQVVSHPENHPSWNISTSNNASQIPLSPPPVPSNNSNPFCHVFQFAIAGFAKCGTTTMGAWLRNHSQIRTPIREVTGMNQGRIDRVARKLQSLVDDHQETSTPVLQDDPIVVGYRNPHDIQYPNVLHFYQHSCPNTKLILMIRHPVLWFESFFNYRRMKQEYWSLKSFNPNDLIGSICNRKPSYVCADTGAFHYYLAKLGKTDMASEDELRLLPERSSYSNTTTNSLFALPNPIFLVDVSQLNDSNATRVEALASQLQSFLGLTTTLPPLPARANSGQSILHAKTKSHKKKTAAVMDICDANHTKIHHHLMALSHNASEWLEDYFLKNPSVVVANRERFVSSILQHDWKTDPCRTRSRQAAARFDS